MGKGKNTFDYKALKSTYPDVKLTKEVEKIKKVVIDLARQSEFLTKKDLHDWRRAWQMAINIEHPSRYALYNIYTDVDVDLHLTGAVGQRKGFVQKKSFKLVDSKGKENPELTEIFESPWFKEFISLALDSRYWGHSLIELGKVITVNDRPAYSEVKLVPRMHVVPEYGVIIRQLSDDPATQGYYYREGNMAPWVIEAGGDRDLGLFLKCAHQTISKKNMMSFWDQFGEMFGMPIRIGKTTTKDEKERSRIERMLADMGAAAWGLFAEGTEIDIKETTRGDAFNVYDRRIERANSELSKGVLNQTMTLDNGGSLSQSQVHLEVFENVVDHDADFIRDITNVQLIPRMIMHGFPLKGFRFNWDESVDYSPEQQIAIETMIADRFEVDPKYFIEKYNVPIIGKKQNTELGKPFFD